MSRDQTLLAIESATARLSVALRTTDGRLFEREPDRPGQHAETILPLIDAVLADAGCDRDTPTVLAVSIGPGSFTSLRVGLATVKGLAFATDRKVVPVPTLEALAHGASPAGPAAAATPIAAVLDARRGDLYAAVFEPSAGGLRALLPDGLFTPAGLAACLPDACRVVGEGAGIFADALGDSLPEGVRVEDAAATRWPRAASVAAIAHAGFAKLATNPDDLAPRYVRRAEAEAKRVDREVEDPT